MKMQFPGIDIDEESREFLQEIVGEMVAHFHIHSEEAIAKIIKVWSGRKFRWFEGDPPAGDYSYLIFHETALHWAHVIYLGRWDWWRPAARRKK